MWFKKKTYIGGYNKNTAVNGTDWRTSGSQQGWSASNTLPDAGDVSKYFYLPALGYYGTRQLFNVSNSGYYWSSSAHPQHSGEAYSMCFFSGIVNVFSNGGRGNGSRVEPAFE